MKVSLEKASESGKEQLACLTPKTDTPPQESPLNGWQLDTRDQSLGIMQQALERSQQNET